MRTCVCVCVYECVCVCVCVRERRDRERERERKRERERERERESVTKKIFYFVCWYSILYVAKRAKNSWNKITASCRDWNILYWVTLLRFSSFIGSVFIFKFQLLIAFYSLWYLTAIPFNTPFWQTWLYLYMIVFRISRAGKSGIGDLSPTFESEDYSPTLWETWIKTISKCHVSLEKVPCDTKTVYIICYKHRI